MKLLAFGLGLGLALGAVRQAPPVGEASWMPLLFVVGLLAWASYRAGRKRRPGAAVATAVAAARAEAAAVAAGGSAAVNLHLHVPGQGPQRWSALDQAPWMLDHDRRSDVAAIEQLGDQLDGLEPGEAADRVREGVPLDDVG